MIRYILVDDNPKILESVKAKIDTIANTFGLKHIQSYHSSKKAFEEINTNHFDLLIVDFEMPVYNGIELAQKIGINKKVIFLTSTKENEKQVINSLDISGYLSKPFDVDDFKQILKNKVIGKVNNKKPYVKGDVVLLTISKNKNIGIYPEEVFFISSALISTGYKLIDNKPDKVEKPQNNLVHFYRKNSEILFENVRLTISELETRLSIYNFRKINQSTLVNANYIRNIDNRNLELYYCKEPFEISAKEKTKFLENI